MNVGTLDGLVLTSTVCPRTACCTSLPQTGICYKKNSLSGFIYALQSSSNFLISLSFHYFLSWLLRHFLYDSQIIFLNTSTKFMMIMIIIRYTITSPKAYSIFGSPIYRIFKSRCSSLINMPCSEILHNNKNRYAIIKVIDSLKNSIRIKCLAAIGLQSSK